MNKETTSTARDTRVGLALVHLPAAFKSVAQVWHDLRVEGFLGIGPVLVTTRRWHDGQTRNALELGRDYGRIEMGGQPLPSAPKLRNLHVV